MRPAARAHDGYIELVIRDVVANAGGHSLSVDSSETVRTGISAVLTTFP